MITTTQLQLMAKQAVDIASASSGPVSLDSAIAKIAQDSDLNQHSLKRLTELVNHEMNDRLRKTATDRTFTFNLASLSGVLQEMPHLQNMPKVAAHQIRSQLAKHVGSESRISLDKVASAITDSRQVSVLQTKQNLKKIANWIETHYKQCLAKQAGLHAAIGEGLDELIRYASTYVMDGKDFSDLKKFACSAFPQNLRVWDVLFDEVHSKVAARLLSPKSPNTKLAARLAPPAKGADLPYQVINGSSKFMTFLDTMKNKISAEDQAAQSTNLLNTFGPAITVGMTRVETVDEVRDYLKEHIEKFAENCSDLSFVEKNIEKLAGAIMSGLGGLAKEVGRAGAGIAKRTWRPALRYGAPLAGAALAADALGDATKKNLGDYRPGAYRGVDAGGTTGQ